jgi:hypothetical protein
MNNVSEKKTNTNVAELKQIKEMKSNKNLFQPFKEDGVGNIVDIN